MRPDAAESAPSPRGRLRAYVTLIRHGESMANVAHILQGQSDSPLTVHGQAQIDALGKYWQNRQQSKFPSKAEPRLSLLVASPIGRANNTANAIASRAISEAYAADLRPGLVKLSDHAGKDKSTLDPDFEETLLAQLSLTDCPAEDVPYFLDRGLAERDFGTLESTKGGVAPSGYQRGSGKGEDRAVFQRRVRAVGQRWIDFAWRAAKARQQGRSVSGSTGEDTCNEHEPFHLVIVTHGLWLSTFLSLFLEPNAKPPFAANTGQFFLELGGGQPPAFFSKRKRDADEEASDLPALRLIRANDVVHLAGVRRQKGGISRLPEDGSQPKLSAFFSATKKSKNA